MRITSSLMEFFPLLSTFASAIVANYCDIGKKWQDYIIGLLGLLFVFFAYLFFVDEFNTSLSVYSFFDIRYNKIGMFIGAIYCASLFIGLFPVRSTVNLSSSFLFYIAGGLGIILANNLPTFFIFWTFQRSIPLIRFWNESRRGESVVGATYIFQHVLAFICFVGLLYFASVQGVFYTPMTEIPNSFLTWQVLALTLIIVYESHGIFPFHSWVHDIVGKVPWYEFSAIFLSRAGVLLFVQLILPTLHHESDIFRILLFSLSIISSIYWSFRGILEENLSKKITYFYIAQASLILTGLQAEQVAVRGSYLHMMVISITGTAMFSIFNFIQHTFSFKRQSHFYGMAQYYPMLATLFCLFGFCLIGVPMGGSHVVEDLVITGLLEYQPYLGLGHIFATCLNGILFFMLFTKIFLGPSAFKAHIKNMDMSLPRMIPYLLALVLMILIGMMPFLFLEKITW